MKVSLLTTFCLCAVVAQWTARLHAQPPLESLISTVGTVTTDTQGRHWAYLSWSSPAESFPLDRRVGVYSKTGPADAGTAYQRRAVTGVQTDPAVIEALLERATQLGFPRGPLEERIDALFGEAPVAGAQSLAAKLSAVIRGGLTQPNHTENLILLARQHPGMAFCLGLAHAERIEGPVGTRTTFELRWQDPTATTDTAVLGRVTVTAGKPLVLPAPGRPHESIDTSPRGDLNVKLLWATPPELRRVSLASSGFNVYRLDAAWAESQSFHLAPPTPSALLEAVAKGAHAYRLNRAAVLAARQLEDAEAAVWATDPANYFFSDSNDRATPEFGTSYPGFQNGAEFYYFVTARDPLGRDGLVSPGRKVRVCDRMPPPPPTYVRVENVYAHDPVGGTRERRLKVLWRPNQDTAPEVTTGYYVHRWSSLQEMQEQSQNPLAGRIAGPIVPVGNVTELEFIDTTPLAPSATTGVGATFWYTVRAVDAGACAPGGNLSYNSSPAFGVIRDFTGPAGGGGGLRIRCVEPTLTFLGPTTEEKDPLADTGILDYRVHVQRTSSRLKHVDFIWFPMGKPTAAQPLGRRFFASDQDSIELNLRWRWSEFGNNTRPRLVCRIGLSNGRTEEIAQDLPFPTAVDKRVVVRFEAGAKVQLTTAVKDCTLHEPVPPEGPDAGTIHPVWVDLNFPNGTREWRLYRRVDGGPATLIQQGDGNFGVGDVLPVRDTAIPAHAAELCYFIQYFDEHGNGGPLLPLGCVGSEGSTALPTPVLAAIQPLGTAAQPRMQLQWTCPTAGVERFEVWVGGTPEAPPTDLSPDLTADTALPPSPLFEGIPGVPAPLYRRYTTRRLGPGFGPGPTFTVSAACPLENHWRVFVRALAASDATGPNSNVERFLWHVPTNPSGTVAWPVRPLPPISSTSFPQVLARFIPANLTPQNPWEGVAIRIGTVNTGLSTEPGPGQPDRYLGNTDPFEHVYQATNGDPLLATVLYRWQVANAVYPQVSGDLIQVSPMLDAIAWQAGTTQLGEAAVLLRDPFVRLFPEPTPPNDVRLRGMYFLDTQPVLEGATYQYALVRFSRTTREPVEVLQTNPVTVP